jgi:hypothetical protein
VRNAERKVVANCRKHLPLMWIDSEGVRDAGRRVHGHKLQPLQPTLSTQVSKKPRKYRDRM